MIETEMLRLLGRFAAECVLALAPAFGHADERVELHLDTSKADVVLAIAAREPAQERVPDRDWQARSAPGGSVNDFRTDFQE